MNSTEKMIVAIEEFITKKVQSFDKDTSPAEIETITELVSVLNHVPRTMEALD